jgi:hypothetical protein
VFSVDVSGAVSELDGVGEGRRRAPLLVDSSLGICNAGLEALLACFSVWLLRLR